MTQEFTIRRADLADLDSIMAIMETAVQTANQADWFVADNRDFVKRHLRQEGFVLLADNQNQQTAGFLIVRFPGLAMDNLGLEFDDSKDRLLKTAHIETVAVLPDFRGNGLQVRLVQAAETLLSQTPYCYFMATVHPDNHYSLNSMIRQGYRILSTTTKYGGLDRHILYKNLDKEKSESPIA